MDLVQLGLYAVLFVAVVTVLRSGRLVQPHEKGLHMRLGRYVRTVEPGMHWLAPAVDDLIRVDLRPRQVELAPEPILTRDGIDVTVQTVVGYQIVDPVRATFEVTDFAGAVRQLVSGALHDAVGGAPLAETLARRDRLAESVRRALAPFAERVGVELGSIEVRLLQSGAGATRAGASEPEPRVAKEPG